MVDTWVLNHCSGEMPPVSPREGSVCKVSEQRIFLWLSYGPSLFFWPGNSRNTLALLSFQVGGPSAGRPSRSVGSGIPPQAAGQDRRGPWWEDFQELAISQTRFLDFVHLHLDMWLIRCFGEQVWPRLILWSFWWFLLKVSNIQRVILAKQFSIILAGWICTEPTTQQLYS